MNAERWKIPVHLYSEGGASFQFLFVRWASKQLRIHGDYQGHVGLYKGYPGIIRDVSARCGFRLERAFS